MLRNFVSLPTRAFRLLWDSLRWDRPFIRNVLVVALPMVIQQLMTASLHIVDGLMVSGLGDAAYSAVTQANRVTFMFNLFSFGTCTGGAIFLSQYWGGRDIRRMRQTMGLTMMFVLIVAAVFMSVSLLMPRQIISLFLPQGESFDRAVEYLSVVAFGYLFTAVDNVYAATLKAAEKTYLPMLSGFASILTNTVLNYAFIFGKLGCPAMGVRGAALATVISAAVSMGIDVIHRGEQIAKRHHRQVFHRPVKALALRQKQRYDLTGHQERHAHEHGRHDEHKHHRQPHGLPHAADIPSTPVLT